MGKCTHEWVNAWVFELSRFVFYILPNMDISSSNLSIICWSVSFETKSTIGIKTFIEKCFFFCSFVENSEWGFNGSGAKQHPAVQIQVSYRRLPHTWMTLVVATTTHAVLFHKISSEFHYSGFRRLSVLCDNFTRKTNIILKNIFWITAEASKC